MNIFWSWSLLRNIHKNPGQNSIFDSRFSDFFDITKRILYVDKTRKQSRTQPFSAGLKSTVQSFHSPSVWVDTKVLTRTSMVVIWNWEMHIWVRFSWKPVVLINLFFSRKRSFLHWGWFWVWPWCFRVVSQTENTGTQKLLSRSSDSFYTGHAAEIIVHVSREESNFFLKSCLHFSLRQPSVQKNTKRNSHPFQVQKHQLSNRVRQSRWSKPGNSICNTSIPEWNKRKLWAFHEGLCESSTETTISG